MDKNLSGSALNILITGGSGFLAGRLASYLFNIGHNISLGTRFPKNLESVEYQKFKIKETNFQDQRSIDNACADIDVVIHAAGMNRYESSRSVKNANKLNQSSTEKLINASLKNKVSKFIFFSTVWVYRQPLQGIYNEESPAVNDHSYATSNRIVENYLRDINGDSRISTSVFRISNVVGHPLVKQANCWDLVANSFCKKIVEDNKIIINSDGLSQRDLISISSFCKIISSFVSLKQQENFLYNLSSERAMNIKDLALIIKKRSKKILNIDPEIIIKKENFEKTPKSPLLISNKRLRNIGIIPNKNLNKDIDELLLFCHNNFKSRKA